MRRGAKPPCSGTGHPVSEACRSEEMPGSCRSEVAPEMVPESCRSEEMPEALARRQQAWIQAFFRERNGAVAAAMQVYGTPYARNFGVSLPEVRRIARAGEPDAELARCLWRAPLRELRLAALHLVPPQSVAIADLPFWAAGVDNSELAEEAAYALISRSPLREAWFAAWIGGAPLPAYAVLLAAARVPAEAAAWCEAALGAVRRADLSETADASEASDAADRAGAALPVGRLLARGAAAMLAAVGGLDDVHRRRVRSLAGLNGDQAAAASDGAAMRLLREELAWRV